MRCYVENIMTDADIASDIRTLIPDALLRRRMSRMVKRSVATAVECMRGIGNAEKLDAIITATGLGCLEDSEKFLRNMIANDEELLNPSPFIQSTFNTVGGAIALLTHNHGYNVTYVNREHSFEDALLDAMMRIADNESENVLLGSYDERTDSQYRIMQRMGAFRKHDCGEGSVFVHLTKEKTAGSRAQIVNLDFPNGRMTEEACKERYATGDGTVVLHNDCSRYGMYFTSSSKAFAEAVKMVQSGRREAIVLNEFPVSRNAVTVVQCMG